MVINNQKFALKGFLMLTTLIGLSSCGGGSSGEPGRAAPAPAEVNFENSISFGANNTVTFGLVQDNRGRSYTGVSYINNPFLAFSVAERNGTTDSGTNVLRARATTICQSLGLGFDANASVAASERSSGENTVNYKEVFNYDATRTNILIESRISAFQIDRLTCSIPSGSQVVSLFSPGGILSQSSGQSGTFNPEDPNAVVHPYGRTPFERLYNYTQRLQTFNGARSFTGVSQRTQDNVVYLALLGEDVYNSQFEASPNDPFRASRLQSSRGWFRRALDRVEAICISQGFSGATPYFDLEFRSESGRAFDQLDRDRQSKTYSTYLRRSQVDINGDGELNDSDQYPWAVIRTINCRSN